jgi:hypothetical protein
MEGSARGGGGTDHSVEQFGARSGGWGRLEDDDHAVAVHDHNDDHDEVQV